MIPSPARRFRQIDALRGVAALCVVAVHLIRAFFPVVTPGELKVLASIGAYFELGEYGVFIFFLVSGFVVPFSLCGERVGGLKRFAVSRFFRLYPLYWASIALALVAMTVTGIAAGAHDGPFAGWEVLLNLTMLQSFFGVEGVQIVFWTLHVELVFYLLCALLFALGLLRRSGAALALGCACLALAASGAAGHDAIPAAVGLRAIDCYALAFMMLGLLWRRALADGDAAARRPFLALLALVCCAVPALEWLQSGGHAITGTGPEHDTLALAAALLTFAAFNLCAKARFGFLVRLGEISYSLYLLHFPLLAFFMQQIGPLSSWAAILPLMALYIALALVVSHLANRALEEPMIERGRLFAEGWASRRAEGGRMLGAGSPG